MDQQTSQRGLAERARDKAARLVRRARLMGSIRHLHGPRRLDLGPDDVTVVALVRDGAFYLDAFLAHYRALGVRHFVFFDNGSTDGTLDRIRQEPGTVIAQSTLPWGAFENDFRRYAAERYVGGHWCLYADMDELFDFGGSADMGLSGLVRYLRAQGHTALVAQMLEMFPDVPLRETAHIPYADAIAQYRFCDLSAVRAVPYHAPEIEFEFFLRANTLADPRLTFLFDGIRGKVFGETCCLTKHPLVLVGPEVDPGVHPHCSAHVACSDITAVIRHYKFTNDPLARDAGLVRDAAIGHGEDRLRLDRMTRNPDVTLMSDTAFAYAGCTDLVARGFLLSSPAYEAWRDGASA